MTGVTQAAVIGSFGLLLKLNYSSGVVGEKVASLTEKIEKLEQKVDNNVREQRERDNTQDNYVKEAILIREDRYWEQKKRGEKSPY